ncbi:hypothetical protein SLE2022_083930 [Rubroshorea leprosula]
MTAYTIALCLLEDGLSPYQSLFLCQPPYPMPQMPMSSIPCASFLSVLRHPELVVFPYETKLPPPHSRSLATSLPGSAHQEATFRLFTCLLHPPLSK